MRYVNIRGHLKLNNERKFVDIDGYIHNNLFYPDKNNVRIFYKVVKCHRQWDSGILVEYMEKLDD